jgi:hypothetical protein
MTDELIPGEARDFILRHIDSVAQLEALLLLRANAQAGWSVGETAKRLYTGEREIAEVLTRLRSDGFLTITGETYRYDCATPELRELVNRVADVYARHLIPITNMIHAKPRRIREFADAFKLRKDK